MSDFDDVLERLLSDPDFKNALGRNADAALAGYQLTAEERDLLGAQVDLGAGDERTVEMRVTKSGVMGMVGPVVSALGSGFLHDVGNGTISPGGKNMLDSGGPVQMLDSGGPTQSMGVDDASPSPPLVEAVGYHTNVDADGDGTWDAYQAYQRPDGGIDIYVDRNHDGVVDFIGHDDNGDGIIESADYDTNFDGTMDTHMVDDNGDGWMDRSEPIPGQH